MDISELQKNFEDSIEESWVVFKIADRNFGIKTKVVQGMTPLPEVIEYPESEDFIRGVINLRGSIIQTYDLSKVINCNCSRRHTHELVDLLNAREEDHVNWLNELRYCIEEGREFTLTTDPHKCKFGVWYDSYQTDDLILKTQLQRFDKPHRAIHQLADKAYEILHSKGKEAALDFIVEGWNRDLAKMISLFEETKAILLENIREIALTVRVDDVEVALVVDSVEEVRNIDKSDIESIDAAETFGSRHLYDGVAKLGDRLVLLFNAENLVLNPVSV